MVEQNFWEMLRAKHDNLTKSGTIVADYLVQHAEDAQYLSISSLAKACGVAEATIFRFCRSLHCMDTAPHPTDNENRKNHRQYHAQGDPKKRISHDSPPSASE